MSHHIHVLIVLFLVTVLVSPSFSAFVVPIHRDRAALRYYIPLNLKTPTEPTNLLIDIGAPYTWVICSNRTFKSTTFHTIHCNTTQCASVYGGCQRDREGGLFLDIPCTTSPWNPISESTTLGPGYVMVGGSLTLSTTDGIKRGQPGQIHDYYFSCATGSMMSGLSKKVTGVASLSRSNVSLPTQISKATSSPNIFALCLPSSSIAPGAAFFGRPKGESYIDEDLSRSLIYTPLISSPFLYTYVDEGISGPEYFIGVTSIKVNGKALKVKNHRLFAINKTGYGGTRIRTIIPYTRLESTLYAALTEAFVKESAALNLTITKVPAPAPFRVCYEARDVPVTHMGHPVVPSIKLVMHSEEVVWKILGDNSMVRIKRKGVNVWCLGFIEGTNQYPSTPALEIGAHQLANNLLEFDLESNRFGFTNSLLSKSPQTTCSNFRFT